MNLTLELENSLKQSRETCAANDFNRFCGFLDFWWSRLNNFDVNLTLPVTLASQNRYKEPINSVIRIRVVKENTVLEFIPTVPELGARVRVGVINHVTEYQVSRDGDYKVELPYYLIRLYWLEKQFCVLDGVDGKLYQRAYLQRSCETDSVIGCLLENYYGW